MSIINDKKYVMPSSGDFYNVLKNTIAPNFTFTQSNLYDAIAQVYLFLDGVPVLDAKNNLGIEYFNETNDSLTFTEVVSDKQRTITEDRFINGLITDFQKGDIERDLTYPIDNGYSMTQTINVGIPTNDSYVFKVDYPIREIEKVEMILQNVKLKTKYNYSHDKAEDWLNISNLPLDITPFVFEKSQWNLLFIPSDLWGDNRITPTQKNTFFYTKGDKYIYVGNLVPNNINQQFFSIAQLVESAMRLELGLLSSSSYRIDVDKIYPTTPYQVKYRITYKAILDGRLKIEGVDDKFKGEERLDQNQGSVDIGRIGLNLFGTALRVGNETLNVTQKFTSFSNRVKKGSVWKDDNGDRWLANIVKTTIFKDFCVSQIEFTKNFNKLSAFIQMNQDKRFNEIDSALTQMSEDNYCEYIYFKLSVTDLPYDAIHLDKNTWQNGILNTFNNGTSDYSIDYTALLSYNQQVSAPLTDKYCYLPLVKYGTANAICFEMKYDNPITIGTQLQVNQSWGFVSYYSEYKKYTDAQGFADIFDIGFFHSNEDSGATFSDEFPIISNETIIASTRVGSFNKLHFFKKPNEIFGLNYELLCLPYPSEDIYIGENFTKKNGLVLKDNNKKAFVLYASKTEKYSILDKVGIGTIINSNVRVTNVVNQNYMQIRLQDNGNDIHNNTAYVSWAICDTDGNIYLAVNQDLAVSSNFELFVTTKHNRI